MRLLLSVLSSSVCSLDKVVTCFYTPFWCSRLPALYRMDHCIEWNAIDTRSYNKLVPPLIGCAASDNKLVPPLVRCVDRWECKWDINEIKHNKPSKCPFDVLVFRHCIEWNVLSIQDRTINMCHPRSDVSTAKDTNGISTRIKHNKSYWYIAYRW